MTFRHSPNSRGFTAIELIIVVIIIGILAAAGMAKYQNFTVTARKASCLSNLEQIKSAVQLAENKYGALTSATVIRFRATGAIDPTRIAGAAASNLSVWVGTVPPAWGNTNNAGTTLDNDKVVSESQDARIFRCPEDVSNLSPTYTSISDLNTGKTLPLVQDLCTYTFAKAGTSTRAAGVFVPAIPLGSPGDTDALEGYNWVTQQIEYKNSTLVFCRRYGLRNASATGGAGVLAPVANDVKYYPGGQEQRLAHSSYAPTK